MTDTRAFLAHYGVLGMKWGHRKEAEVGGNASTPSALKKPSEKPQPVPVLTKKLKNGGEVSIYQDPPPPIARFLAARSAKYAAGVDAYKSFTLKDKTGAKVGDASFNREPDGSLNLVWLGIKAKHRGNGYASAAMQGVVKYAQKNGIKKLTLEVPGNSPDALHIYSKLGFTVDKVQSDHSTKGDTEDVWGGLTSMTYHVGSVKHDAMQEDDPAWQDAFAEELAQFLTDNIPLPAPSVSHSEEGVEVADVTDFLAHYGVLGMKWGRRKGDTNLPSLRKPRSTGPSRAEPHQDAVLAKAAKAKAKTHGLDSLSNKELQDFISRTNLEQQYAKLTPQQKSKGKKFVSDVVGNTAKSVASQYAQQGLKTGIDAAIKYATKK